jgi:hypothetical protein
MAKSFIQAMSSKLAKSKYFVLILKIIFSLFFPDQAF